MNNEKMITESQKLKVNKLPLDRSMVDWLEEYRYLFALFNLNNDLNRYFIVCVFKSLSLCTF